MPSNVIVLNGAISWQVGDSKMEPLLAHLDALAKREPVEVEDNSCQEVQ